MTDPSSEVPPPDETDPHGNRDAIVGAALSDSLTPGSGDGGKKARLGMDEWRSLAALVLFVGGGILGVMAYCDGISFIDRLAPKELPADDCSSAFFSPCAPVATQYWSVAREDTVRLWAFTVARAVFLITAVLSVFGLLRFADRLSTPLQMVMQRDIAKIEARAKKGKTGSRKGDAVRASDDALNKILIEIEKSMSPLLKELRRLSRG